MNAREAAYLAVMASAKEERYASEFLDDWKRRESPSVKDDHLAREIAFGSIQRKLTLDYLGAQLTPHKKLNLKTKELVLLRTALYQFYFMDRIPLYALTNETQNIAKKYCHRTFCSFLNALLRKLEHTKLSIPEDPLSLYYSYPDYFVRELVKDYGMMETKRILELGNTPAITMARKRSSPFNVAPAKVVDVANSPEYYIQNLTPVLLIKEFSASLHSPKKILDLCASPGGKTLLMHDIFPQSQLYANDVSEEKLERIRENSRKYGIDVTLSCGPGEKYPCTEKFDLVIVDAPCSNTGVLNKRAEARWRLSPENVKQLEAVQLKLLENASRLSNRIWYMTCSILKEENEGIAQKAAEQLGLKIEKQLTILPDQNGQDGGYACELVRR